MRFIHVAACANSVFLLFLIYTWILIAALLIIASNLKNNSNSIHYVTGYTNYGISIQRDITHQWKEWTRDKCNNLTFTWDDFLFVCFFLLIAVKLLSHVQLFVTPWTAICQTSLFLSPRVSSNSCPLSRWCHLTIPSSVAPFSSCP